MSVGIPSANPAYSLQSVLQSQVEGLSQPNPPSSSGSPTAAGDATTKPTYNNLPNVNPPSADHPSNDLPTSAPPAPSPAPDAIAAAKGDAANLATSTTASTLTAGGTVSLQPYKDSATQLVFTNDTTGAKSVIGTVSAGLTTNVNGSNDTSGNTSANDVGVYAATQNGPAPLPGTQDAAISVQSGATQGSSTDAQGAPSVQPPAPQVSQAILQGANDDAGHLSGLISQYA